MNTQSIIAELEHVAVSTKKLLERLPEEKLSWKPHEKAMTLGQLALHVATNPGNIARYAQAGTTTAEELLAHPFETRKDRILNSFETSLDQARKILNSVNGNWETQDWQLTSNSKTIFALPRPMLCRMLLLNHWYHHRGQLTVYLRILGIALPATYGPSADENPFAQGS